MWYFLLAMKKYAVFSGRSTRSEYWYFLLFSVILAVLIAALSALGPAADDVSNFLFGLFLLVIIVPSFAVTVRRLHDIGRSGWWVLINLIPVGGIVIWILAALPSQPGQNKYGPNPLGIGEGDDTR